MPILVFRSPARAPARAPVPSPGSGAVPAARSARVALHGGLSSLAGAMAAAVVPSSRLGLAPVAAWAEDELSGTMIFDETGRIISGGGGSQEEMEKKVRAHEHT